MEEKEEEPSEKPTQTSAGKMWQCQICGARIWLSNKSRHTNTKKHKDANYILTERFEMK
ncbi:MAG: hypothetical protein ACKPKO_53055 [Candidatus Fonsibacter sp.]